MLVGISLETPSPSGSSPAAVAGGPSSLSSAPSSVRTRRGRPGEEPVVVEIADEGHGIPRAELTKIFEPFYTSKPPGRGTGLGLSICYSIVADHDGRIEVDSHLGKGTTFRVLLPAAHTEGTA